MTSKRRTGISANSMLAAYKTFHRHADAGNYREAFAVFKAQPHLMNHMTILEISIHCREMSSQLPKRQAIQFIEAVERRMLDNVRLLEMARLFDREVRESWRKHGKN
jgi:hypothetical protein